MRALLATIGSLALLAAACGGGSGTQRTPAATPPAATATLAPDDAPMPEHVTFAPGETISAPGKAGIFFLDPKTGAAEAWLVPAGQVPGQADIGAMPFTFSVGAMSADGRWLVYTCEEHDASGRLAPCAGAPQDVWYLFDSRTGARTRITAFAGAPQTSVSISPDGKTLLRVARGAATLASAEDPASTRTIDIPADPYYTVAGVGPWRPDSSAVVVYAAIPNTPAGRAFLLNIEKGLVTQIGSGDVAWAPDGSRFASVVETPSAREIRMRTWWGGTVWSKPLRSLAGGPKWSADGKLVYVFQREADPTASEPNPPDRGDVLDATTGATLLRVHGSFCPEGWVGSTHRFVAATYGAGEIVVDVDTATYQTLAGYAHPAPFDDNNVYAFDGSDFRAVDIATGATRLIAHTTVTPAWDPAHPLFAGDRIFFTPLHGGHGGCGEGSGPTVIPKVEVQRGPFADDAPVTRAD